MSRSSFDPLSDLSLTREQRRAVMRGLWRQLFRSPACVTTVVVWMVFVVAIPPWIGPMLQATLMRVGLSAGWAKVAAIVVLGAVNIAVFTFFWLRLYVAGVRAALRECGHDVCRNCGYWLRGLGADTTCCPECGAAREPMEPPPAADN